MPNNKGKGKAKGGKGKSKGKTKAKSKGKGKAGDGNDSDSDGNNHRPSRVLTLRLSLLILTLFAPTASLEDDTDEHGRAYVTQKDPLATATAAAPETAESAAAAATAVAWQFCTVDELVQQIEADLGQPVLPHRMDPVLPAFTRPAIGDGDGTDGGNVDGAAVRLSGFDSCFTGTVSRLFFDGQPVVYEEGKGPPALGVVRAVFPAAAAGEALYTVETACVCDHCRTPAPCSKCSRCKAVWYCGRGCQADGWKVHQRSCGAGAGGGGAPVPMRTDKGSGIVVVMHAGVPAARLRPAVGRDFDVQAMQQTAFLEALAERVGADPGGERWKAEVPTVIKEDWVRDGILASMDDPKYAGFIAGPASFARSLEAFCEQPRYKMIIDAKLEQSSGALSRKDAQLLAVFAIYGCVLAAAVREARGDYAGLTHAYYNLLVRLADGCTPAPDCYKHLQDTTSTSKSTGLQDEEPGWAGLVRAAIAAAPAEGRGRLCGLHCMTAAGTTIVNQAQPTCLAPEGFRQKITQRGGAMEVQDSVVLKFASAGRDGAGLHTAVFTDHYNHAFPPMTQFTAVEVQVGAFEFDGTAGLLGVCKVRFGGRAPTAVPGADGRPRVGRAQLIKWLVENAEPGLADDLASGVQGAIDWFHSEMMPPGVESTIYTVNRTLVTVQATYLLPAAAAVAGSDSSGQRRRRRRRQASASAAVSTPAASAAAGCSSGGPGNAGDAVHTKLMADSTQLG
jgi:hypothetical protein